MAVKIIIGAVVGGAIGFGMNYLCIMTGGACPLMKFKVTAIFVWALIGAMIGAVIGNR